MVYTLPREHLLSLSEHERVPSVAEVEVLLASRRDTPLGLEELALLVAAIHSPQYPEIRRLVMEASARVRLRKHGGDVVTMAPIEVSNRCASNCQFCGWRSDNKQMKRLSIENELVLMQSDYLLSKGIKHIELVGGDDVKFVRDTLPRLVPELRKQTDRVVGGRVLFCTMALTRAQYDKLRESGAHGMIMWQETYDEVLYNRHITSGPKAHGIDDNFKVVPHGDGFRFRLESQDRAAQSGLQLSVGAMLGLNGNVAFEMLATVDHARYLCDTYQPQEPVVVGMPTWNRITTPETDNRPERVLDIEEYFAFFASLYMLALVDKNVWIFPNCRVALSTQIDAVRCAGAYTSTEVKVGPGGYLPQMMLTLSKDRRESVLQSLRNGLKSQVTLDGIVDELDRLEQFRHHYHLHEQYIDALREVGISPSA